MKQPENNIINIFTGYFGSGKTEIAINFALCLRNAAPKVCLVDLDIVNPYFRSREQRDMLLSAGVDVLASVEEYFNTDLPALSPAISGALQDKYGAAVLDVGGDETGARVLGRYNNLFTGDNYCLFFVINPYRPLTTDQAGIGKVLRAVEQTSRLRVTALISNPNLGCETHPADIINGHRTVLAASHQFNLPVSFLCVPEHLADAPELREVSEPIFPVRLYMLPPWLE